MARKYSNDKLSNKKNGDIGWVSRNEIAKKISDEIFTIKNIEGISGIVEVESGFYLLKLKGLKEAKVKSFSEVKDAVKKDYENIQVVNKYDEIFEDLSNILFENPDSLINVEEYLSVKKISTGLSTLSKIKKDHKILNNQKVLESLSSQSVSNDNQNSAPIEVKDNIVMLRINNKSPVEYKKYEDVKKEVESLINTENAIESMNESIKNIETKIKEGADIKDIENLINKKSTYYSDIERADNSIPPSILTKVFSLTKDNNVTSIESGTGNYELIVLDSIEKGESDLSRKSLKTMFYNEQVNVVLYSVIQSLREQAKIKIYPKNL